MMPTLPCNATSSGRSATFAKPCAMATACSSCKQSNIRGSPAGSLVRKLTMLSCNPRKLEPGTSAT